MVATLAQMASAEYYMESQRSYRHPNEYYTAGEEPDGTWFNPHGLFGLADGSKIDSRDFFRLYNGFAPDGSGKLTQNAGGAKRSPGLDMTFSVDKSVSALWAIAEPGMRVEIEGLATTAARAALEDTVLKYSSYTRTSGEDEIVPVPADLVAATFLHGTSRENDPQLHIHCTILNVARTHKDGKYRAHHQYPAYSWSKAAGSLFRAYLAWELQQSLGVKMEQYGQNGAYTRIPDVPKDLLSFWSKRRKAIIAKAGELGIPVRGNASRLEGVNKLTRAGKSHDNDPEVRHRRWRGEVEGFAEREALIAGVTANEVDIPRERIRELTEQLDALPAYLAREEAVFKRPDIVEAAGNRAAGLLGREGVMTAIERVRRNPEIEDLELPKSTAESNAGMVHTERYSTRHNLGQEQAVRDMGATMAADTECALPMEAIETKVETLLGHGYPLSGEQIEAIRFATARGARVAVIEGAAGSGKTTTLRPITDLHREHGYDIVPTAVAWRTAVALGNDCEARPFCVDKLLKMAARGQIEIGKNTLIVVDEAGMLSTRQAHHILQLSERHGAKIVFAGDTRQQQPVEAGPGLRLIRDVAGSVRVDRIRRQKADLEDVLVHVRGETPETARFQAGLTGRQERDRVLGEFEAISDVEKPAFTPWQVTASEALRDGDAAAAIEALRVRGRFHICHDEENTLTRLVEDWARGVRDEPDKSSIVLARTRAETRALSHLMRERHLAWKTDTKRVVVEVSRNAEDGRIVEPLEIAVGDRLRIGATQWEKQLFNGTIVTVEDFKVLRGGAEKKPDETGLEPAGPSVRISARTDDGRKVLFRHDEIRDYHDNIRLDYGYALTITSAQGLTVDRAYLLADDRPARETIYPAATRHREGLDIYVNRAPIALTIAERRPEDQAERPVMDSDIRAYLAERWSRSQPKEAALDYITDGAWRDQRENTRKQQHGAQTGQAANDNVFVRIAGEIRHKALGWRHGAAVDELAAGRAAVLAEYDGHRALIGAGDDSVALGAAFADTLARHAVLLKVAEPFRARPAMFERLLAERGAIARKDLDGFEAQYVRAHEHRRVVSISAAHARRRETIEAPEQELNRGEMAPVAASAVMAAPETTHTPVDARQAAWDAYESLKQDWSRYLAAAEQAGIHVIYIRGTEGLIERIKALAGNPDLLDTSRQSLEHVLGLLDEETGLRREVEDYLGAVESKLRYRRDVLEAVADELRITVPGLAGYGDWRKEIDPLAETGRRIQADREAYGIHLDSIALGAERLERALSTIHGKLGEDDEYISEQRERRRKSEGAVKPDDNFTAERKAREQQSERVDHQNEADKPAETDTAPDRPDVRTLCEALERDWNQLDERADRFGVSIFDMEGSEPLIARMRSLTENPDLPDRTRQELASMLEKYQQHVASRNRDTVTAASPTPDESAAAPGDAKPEATEKARAPSPAPAEPPSVPSPPDWQPAYDAFVRDWNALSKGARQSGTPFFYSRDYADLITILKRLVEKPDIPTETRAPMIQALENHQRHVSTRIEVQDWLIAVERYMDRRDSLEDAADNLDIPVAEALEYPDWRREAERLTAVGKDILSDTKTYGAHLANITRGETRMKWGLSDLRDAIREAVKERTERQAPEQPIEPGRDWSYRNQLAEDARLGAGPIFGSDTGNLVPPDTMSADGTGLEGALFRLRRTLGWENWEDYVRKRTVEDMRRSQNRWEELRQDWNREVEHAKQAGIHVIYRRDYQHLRRDLEFMANDTHIGRGLSPAISDALNQLRKAEASREHIEEYRDSIAKYLAERSGWLGAKTAERSVPIPEHKDYRIWRAAIDGAVRIGEGIIANRGADNVHFAGVALMGKGLGSAISKARKILHDDDRQIARSAMRERQAERAAIRKDGYAHILEDPETHRKRLEEAMKRQEKTEKQQRKGRHMSMRM